MDFDILMIINIFSLVSQVSFRQLGTGAVALKEIE